MGYIFLFSMLLMFLVFVKSLRANGSLDVMHPAFNFLILYFFYSYSFYFSILSDVDVSNTNLAYFLFAIFIGFLSFILGYKFSSESALKFVTPSDGLRLKNDYSVRATFILFFLLLTIVFPDNVLDILKFNPLPYTEVALRESRSATSGLVGFLKEIQIHLLIFIFLSIPFSKRKFSIIGFFVSTFIALYALKGGSKGIAIYIGLFWLLYYNYFVAKIKLSFLLIAFAISIPVFSIFSHVRSVSDIHEMIAIGIDLVEVNPNLLLPLSFGEFTGSPKTLLDIISITRNDIGQYNFGSRWLAELAIFIPFAIYPDRPLPSSELYMILFKPNALDGAGEGWFIINDGYWAFGFFGVFLIMFLYGRIICYFYHCFIIGKNTNILYIMGYPYLFFVLVVTSVRTGFFGSIKVALLYFLLFFIFYLTSKIVFVFRSNFRGPRKTLIKSTHDATIRG